MEDGIHRSGTEALGYVVDLLERYIGPNTAIILDHDNKLAKRKRTRRDVPDRLFRDATRVMTEIRNLFEDIKI